MVHLPVIVTLDLLSQIISVLISMNVLLVIIPVILMQTVTIFRLLSVVHVKTVLLVTVSLVQTLMSVPRVLTIVILWLNVRIQSALLIVLVLMIGTAMVKSVVKTYAHSVIVWLRVTELLVSVLLVMMETE